MVKKKNNFEEQVLTSLKEISSKLLDHDKIFTNHDKQFNNITDKLLGHEKIFLNHDGKFNRIIDKLLDHGEIYKIYNSKFDELKDIMLTHFDKIYGKLERLESEYSLLNAALKRIEEKMVSREELAELKKQTLDLLKRIESLESKVGA